MVAGYAPGTLGAKTNWTRPELIALSDAVLAEPDLPTHRFTDIVTITTAGLDWDIAAVVHEPCDPAHRMIGPAGLPVGFFLLHGGEGDYRSMETLARMLAAKMGVRVVSMTYPGRFRFDDPDHNWPGDTVHPDGGVRLPIWQRGEQIRREDYDVVSDASGRHIYGTRTIARARPGSLFYRRMAGWPMAMEDGALALMARYFPPAQWSVCMNGHSTGGPFAHMLLQRVPNICALMGIESSPFGAMWSEMTGIRWPNGFNDLVIRTWRDQARYRGAEVAKTQGAEALMALPALMEDVFSDWEHAKAEPQFKAEYMVHFNNAAQLRRAAEVTADALALGAQDRAALIDRYCGYAHPLPDTGRRPLPPMLYIVCALSRDHTRQRYEDIAVPMLRAADPNVAVSIISFGAGTHYYADPQPDFPAGLCPAAIAIWRDSDVLRA
jgi:hypothetical protein